MDFQIRISEAALTDFEEILAYSWARFPHTTERFGAALLNHVNLLRSFPFIGHPIAGRPRVRGLVHTPIVIYYNVDEDRGVVEIIHFWHGSRRT